jgi:hypothetical protein
VTANASGGASATQSWTVTSSGTIHISRIDTLWNVREGRPLVGFARTLRLCSGQANSVRAGPSTPLRFAQDDGVELRLGIRCNPRSQKRDPGYPGCGGCQGF